MAHVDIHSNAADCQTTVSGCRQGKGKAALGSSGKDCARAGGWGGWVGGGGVEGPGRERMSLTPGLNAADCARVCAGRGHAGHDRVDGCNGLSGRLVAGRQSGAACRPGRRKEMCMRACIHAAGHWPTRGLLPPAQPGPRRPSQLV